MDERSKGGFTKIFKDDAKDSYDEASICCVFDSFLKSGKTYSADMSSFITKAIEDLELLLEKLGWNHCL